MGFLVFIIIAICSSYMIYTLVIYVQCWFIHSPVIRLKQPFFVFKCFFCAFWGGFLSCWSKPLGSISSRYSDSLRWYSDALLCTPFEHNYQQQSKGSDTSIRRTKPHILYCRIEQKNCIVVFLCLIFFVDRCVINYWWWILYGICIDICSLLFLIWPFVRMIPRARQAHFFFLQRTCSPVLNAHTSFAQTENASLSKSKKYIQVES